MPEKGLKFKLDILNEYLRFLNIPDPVLTGSVLAGDPGDQSDWR